MKFIACPECEANFPATTLVDGKLPPHKFCSKVCPGAGGKP